MNDPDQSVEWRPGVGDDLPESLWALDDLTAATDRPGTALTGGLVSLSFMKSAIRRGRRVWCLTAVLGLLIGLGLYVKYPPAAKATVSVLLTDNPNEDPAVEVQTDAALAQSTMVGQGVVQQLGLHQTVSSILAAYSVTVVTDRVLSFTVGAPTSAEAVQRAAAIATQFLKFRGQYAQIQEQQAIAELNQQVTQAQQHLDSINQQLSQAKSNGSSQSDISGLESKQKSATDDLAQVQQYQTGTQTTLRAATQAMVQGSQVLDVATPMKPSRLKGTPLYVGGGIIGGLAVGMAIVIIGAILSDRLLRRDDVAAAFGAPVRLSVATLAPKGRLSGMAGRHNAGKEARDLRRVVEHLRTSIPGSSRGPAALAVVAVDNAQTVARAVVSLAEDAADHGRRVFVADLSSGRHAGRLLGADKPGVSSVNVNGRQLVVAVPDPDEVVPIGPLRSPVPSATYARPSEQLNAAASVADLLLVLVTLDPAFGGDHLGTWATDVVAVVTAGMSTAGRVHAVGEMIRMSGTRQDSVVLLGADKNDESLGARNTSDHPAPV